MTEKTPGAAEKQTFHHKYRWTGEEIGTLVGLGVLAVGVLVWSFLGDWLIVGAIVAAAFILVGVYASRLGFKRKRKSALTGEYDPATDRLSVGGHEYEAGRNYIVLSDVASVGYKHLSDGSSNRFSPKDLLLFQWASESRNLKVPARLLSDEKFAELVSPLIEAKGSAEAKEAAEFGRNYGG